MKQVPQLGQNEDWRHPHGSPDTGPSRELLFLFVGGSHQILHLGPVAAAFSLREPGMDVRCLYRDDGSGRLLRWIKRVFHADNLVLEKLPPPRWSQLAAQALHNRSLEKLPMLYRLVRQHRHPVALITPERTSAALRKMGLRDVPLIHFRHGAGDRAPDSESRLRAFDLVVVPGEKDLLRARDERGVDATHLRVSGYVKLDFLARLERVSPAPLFDNDRPVVLYNPHFDSAHSSWPMAREIVEQFRTQSRYNLVLAPHIRLRGSMSHADAVQWHDLAVPGKIIVDLDSDRLVDMTYTRAADVYLGDVSSQLYEFLYRPRPVAFVNAHGVDWQDNPRFAGWELGEVTDAPEGVLDAVDRAVELQPTRVAQQREAVRNAFGDWHGACERGAEILAEYLAAQPTPAR